MLARDAILEVPPRSRTVSGAPEEVSFMWGYRRHGSVVGVLSLLLSSLIVPPSALAQQSLQGAVNQTAIIGSFTPGQSFTDAFGNTLSVGSVYTGQIGGAPI